MKSTLQIGIIGLGKLGVALAECAHHSGIKLSFLCGRPNDPLKDYFEKFDCPVFTDTEHLDLSQTDLLFLCVQDHQIAKTVQSLKAVGKVKESLILAHTSGADGTKVLEENSPFGEIRYGTFHPPGAFLGKEDEWKKFRMISCLVDGKEDVRNELSEFARELGATPIPGNKVDHALYHAACSMAANYLVSLFEESKNLMNQAGIPESLSGRLVSGLMMTSLKNVNTEDVPLDALTGPILRGDKGTIESHLKALDEVSPESKGLYLNLGKKLYHQLKESKRLDHLDSGPLEEIFS